MTFEYVFILYKETDVHGAISNDILRRAIGVSKYREVRLLLIGCSEEYVNHARCYLVQCSVNILGVYNIREAYETILKRNPNESILVTHSWPDTLFCLVPPFKSLNLVLIEEVPPLFDRLPTENRKRSYKDRILSNKTVIRIITFRYRRYVMAAKMYVAISDFEKDVLEKYYSLSPDMIVYEPVDERFFSYTESERASLMVFGNPRKEVIKCIIYAIGQRCIKEIILVNSNLDLSNYFAYGVRISEIHNYNFLEIKEMYRRTLLSVTDESRGSFELIPIESIMSGVPIISPVVPSLQILRNRIDSQTPEGDDKIYPYFDYLNLLKEGCKASQKLGKWFHDADRRRAHFSGLCFKLFSMVAVGKDFITKVENHFSSDSEK